MYLILFSLTRWTLQLYLTPSGLIYSVSGVLLALCVGLAGIVLLLHLREKVYDLIFNHPLSLNITH